MYFIVYQCFVFWLYDCLCFFKQKTAYEMRISDWSSDVCSSDLTMVYGIIGMINFAHGDIYMIGAFLSVITFLVLGTIGFTFIPLALMIVLQIGRAPCRERVCQYV